MRNRILIALAVFGIVAGIVSSYVLSKQPPPLPPVFTPATNPYDKGIYVNGIIESYLPNGANINVYPEVSGKVTQILVSEGQAIRRGHPMIRLDDSVQAATAAQQQAQADAAHAVLSELRAQPRRETLDVAAAQAELAKANLKSASDQYEKLRRSYEVEPKSVSKDSLDNAHNAVKVAQAGLDVAQKQYVLTKAGAWEYDIRNQERQYEALSKAHAASQALLAKYTIAAPIDGVVLSVNAAVGDYVSPQGAYQTYTQGYGPVIVVGSGEKYMAVRCYVDEVLIHNLPPEAQIKATMSIRGTDVSVPLEYVRMEPYVIPKVQLSDQRAERVDVRVLPLVFRFPSDDKLPLYPGQLVDVYIGRK